MQTILVNAHVQVDEESSYDNWNGGTYGHTLRLILPDSLYLANFSERENLEQGIKEDINNLHRVQNEWIDQVVFEMGTSEDKDWRKDSGLLITARQVSADAASRLWAEGRFRLFLSHKAEVKVEAARLKEDLSLYGVSAFVAHEDIHPTKEWQNEIENALATMDGFAALLTSDFHESDWTDQEVGYALSRGIPIVPVRLGRDPYGFLGKFQALSTDWTSAALDIVRLLMAKGDRMASAYIAALRNCKSFNEGNILSRVLPSIAHLSESQVDELIKTYNSSVEIRGSFGFNGSRPFEWGGGLISHLPHWGPRKFVMHEEKRIKLEPTTPGR